MQIFKFISYKNIIIYLVLPLLVALCGMIYKRYSWLPQDNPAEEIVEKVIEDYTGKDIDLSPDSKEKR